MIKVKNIKSSSSRATILFKSDFFPQSLEGQLTLKNIEIIFGESSAPTNYLLQIPSFFSFQLEVISLKKK